jgi:hypothetical protein
MGIFGENNHTKLKHAPTSKCKWAGEEKGDLGSSKLVFHIGYTYYHSQYISFFRDIKSLA